MLQPDRLVANDFIQCRKVAEHILDKLLGEGTAGSPGAGDTDASSPTNNGTSVDQIELTCNDQVCPNGYFQCYVKLFCSQVLDPSMDLRTVKHFIWKSSADLTLYYKLINTK